MSPGKWLCPAENSLRGRRAFRTIVAAKYAMTTDKNVSVAMSQYIDVNFTAVTHVETDIDTYD